MHFSLQVAVAQHITWPNIYKKCMKIKEIGPRKVLEKHRGCAKVGDALKYHEQ